jgi:hypothetical protein
MTRVSSSVRVGVEEVGYGEGEGEVEVSLPLPLVSAEEELVGKTSSGASRKLHTPAGRSEIKEKIWLMSACCASGGTGV